MATTTEASSPVAKKRGWLGRNWGRLLALVILLPVIAAGAGYYIKFWPLVSSEPYKKAVDVALASPELAAEIGSPIRRIWNTWAPAGEVHEDSGRGEARFSFAVAGPNGKAELSATARQVQGQWGFSSFQASAGEKQIDLAPEANKGLREDTPAFDPDKHDLKSPTYQKATPEQDVKIDLDLPGDSQGKK